MFLDYGRKPENPERTHTAWGEHTNSIQKDPGVLTGTQTGRDGKSIHILYLKDERDCFDMWSDHIRTCESGMMGTTAETPRGQQGACRPVEPHQQSSAGVHQSHDLSSDNKRLTCSILRKYRRPICKATGDNAHTQKLCPEATLRVLPCYVLYLM
uniref:Nanos-type domain-containing protein n=1 Tax=Stegastes partitus TaxID=144197 RepID=A0A3B4Z8A0_9TELE